MARPKGREPRVDIRRYRLKDGTIRENPGVRFYDADGTCRRVGFASLAEAELERARMVEENGAQRPGAVDGSTTLEAFWPVWLAGARERLAELLRAVPPSGAREADQSIRASCGLKYEDDHVDEGRYAERIRSEQYRRTRAANADACREAPAALGTGVQAVL